LLGSSLIRCQTEMANGVYKSQRIERNPRLECSKEFLGALFAVTIRLVLEIAKTLWFTAWIHLMALMALET
jgi:hypothetical protein